MKYRYIAVVILFITILFLPYWVYVPLLLGAIIVFPFFWEAILLGFLIDALYGRELSLLTPFFSTAFWCIVALAVMLPVRTRLRI